VSQQLFDPSEKWMLEEHGASLLYLAGARSVVSCKALKAEVVQPRKLPDGLLEVRYAGVKEPGLVLVEMATYPEKRVVKQMQDGITLVRQTRGGLPEALVLCMSPRGTYRVPGHATETSRQGWTSQTLSWKVVEMWTFSAEELLAVPDVGVVPLVTLARYDGPPEVLLQRCRDRIERDGGKEKENLLAVSQVFAQIHFNQPKWLGILGGNKMMSQSPLIQELRAESRQEERTAAILDVLMERFHNVTPTITAGLEQVKEKDKLVWLTRHAAVCESLRQFEETLLGELPPPAPTSTRGKRRPKKRST
jgi:hypothetical protein